MKDSYIPHPNEVPMRSDLVTVPRAELEAIRTRLRQAVECGSNCPPCDENLKAALAKLEAHLKGQP